MPKDEITQKIKCHFDFPRKKVSLSLNGRTSISGWCFLRNSGHPLDRVFVRIGDRVFDCIKTVRADAATEASIDASNVGFAITLIGLPSGLQCIEVFAEYDGVTTTLRKFWLLSTQRTQGLSSGRLKSHFDAPKSRFFQSIKGQITVAGCILPTRDQTPDRVFLKIGERLIACETVDRDDWVDVASRPTSIKGFAATFSTGTGFKLVEIIAERDGREVTLRRALFWVRRDDGFENSDFYDHWIETIEPIGDRLLSQRAAKFPDHQKGPNLAMICPCYNTPPELLDDLVLSLREQSHDQWKLYLINDQSTDPATTQALHHHEQSDARIQLIESPTNGNISHATNLGIKASREEWILFIDHDDRLTEQALLHFATEIREHPEAKLIYSDEDKLDQGKRVEPHFKPDWNPTLLRSQNYICHLVALRRDLVDEIGFLNSDYDGAQDHDFLLRCSEKLSRHEVRHIPWICYHWRKVEGSTAGSTEAKSPSRDRGLAAVDAHLKRLDPNAFGSEGDYPHTYRSHWPLKNPMPSVELIIPTRNGGERMRKCVQSLITTADYPALKITIVDNQSDDQRTLGLLERLALEHGVRILKYDRPFNYSAINNWAVNQSEADFIGLINDDIESTGQGWLQEMLGHAVRPENGAVGAKLFYPDKINGIQHGGVVVGLGGVAGHGHKNFSRKAAGYHRRLLVAHQVTAVTAACLIVKRDSFLKVGGLNEKDLKVAFNDVDFCLKLHKAGFRNIWTPHAQFLHHESASRGKEDTPEKKLRFQKEAIYMLETHQLKTFVDPCYSPHLTLDSEDFAITRRPHPVFLDPEETRPAEFEKTLSSIQQIVIHIGLHKTGTTSVQHCLAENRRKLKENGYLYPRTLGQNHSKPIEVLFGPEPKYASTGTKHSRRASDFGAKQERLFKALKQEILNSGCHSLILSGEGISILNQDSLEHLRIFLQELAPEATPRILCFTREPIAHATSATQQIIKERATDFSPVEQDGSPKLSNKRKVLEKFIQVFGKPQITVETYESAAKHKKGLVPYIIRTLGITTELQLPETNKPQLNQSLSQNAVDLIRFISTKATEMVHEGALKQKLKKNDLDPFWQLPGPPFTLPSEVQTALENAAKDDQEWLKNEFGITFPDLQGERKEPTLEFNEPYAATFLVILPDLPPITRTLALKYIESKLRGPLKESEARLLKSILDHPST